MAGAVLKTDGAGNGMGFDCARSPPIWKANRAGAPAPLGKRLAPSRVCDSSSQPPAILGSLTGAASGLRSKRMSAERHGDRHVRLPPILRQHGCTAAQASELKASHPLTQRGALAARVAHNHEVGHSIRPAATNSESADKDRLVPSLRCKRSPFGQEVRFRPLSTMRPWSSAPSHSN